MKGKIYSSEIKLKSLNRQRHDQEQVLAQRDLHYYNSCKTGML